MKIYSFIRWADRHGWHNVVGFAVKIGYVWKRLPIRLVAYNAPAGLWEYQVGKSFFVTKGPSWFSSDAYYLGNFKQYAGFNYLPQPGDTVLDIGAGVGEEAVAVAKLIGNSGRLHAFEANPRTCSVLRRVVEKNNFSNVCVYPLAVTDVVGPVEIEDDGGYGVANALGGMRVAETVSVQGVSVDDFVRQQRIDRIDLLKANIEGAERLLIRGMKQSISKIRHVAISCHDFRWQAGESDFFKTKQEVVSALEPHFHLVFQNSGDPVRDDYVYGTNRLVN